ncbi:uncharacterized protein J4E87_008045 [Alternaria ethzedia]|uniref:uncharacterized protein n=1 Tax=Alternaria ethzedia TaxID=181014 RepID=UPI0020C2654B|nr:uncharacterized protein J4E87_008045 [Alternaria ethzedia]KAI4618036.1 hypothetical protein J4E87_008045 [Alternaria ethzedia]
MAPAMNDATNLLDVDNAQDGFGELLIAFNSYVEELLHQPAFHLFMTLPAEIRCMVYKQYFLDEKHSIACQNWPNLRFSEDYEQSIRLKRKHSPFLPSLCLTSKSLRSELLSCLLEAAQFKFDDCTALSRIMVSLEARSLHLHVRKAKTRNVNGQRGIVFLEDEPGRSEEDARELAQRCNKVNSSTIKRFSRLRELNVTLYSPLLCTPGSGNTTFSIRPISFDMFLHDFQLQAILGLEELQKLTITKISGAAGTYDTRKQIKLNNDGLVEDDKSSNITAVLDFCRQIKHGFTIQGRNVTVKACLQYCQDVYEERIFL